jgi:uncharacterized protein
MMLSPFGYGYDRLVLGDYTMRLLKMFLVLFTCVAAAPAVAGPSEDASAAHAKGDYATALRLHRPPAEKGALVAQFNLGGMYYEGKGVAPDYAAALTWYLKAADQSDCSCPDQPRKHVFFWQGHRTMPQRCIGFARPQTKVMPVGHFDVGSMYYQGLSLPQDYAAALSWYLSRKARCGARPE